MYMRVDLELVSMSVEKVLFALRGMARRKAPGLDGLPMRFYLKFWSVLGSDLVSVLNSSFDSGCLSLSAQRCYFPVF